MTRWRWAVVFVVLLAFFASAPTPLNPVSDAVVWTGIVYALARAASWGRDKWRDRRADPGGEAA